MLWSEDQPRSEAFQPGPPKNSPQWGCLRAHPPHSWSCLSCSSLPKLISWEGAQPASLDDIWSCGMGSCQGFGHIAAITSHNAVREIDSFGHPFAQMFCWCFAPEKKIPTDGFCFNVWSLNMGAHWMCGEKLAFEPWRWWSNWSPLNWSVCTTCIIFIRVTAVIQLDSSFHSAQISALSVPLRTEEYAQRCSHPQTLIPRQLQIYHALNLAAPNAEALIPFPTSVRGTGTCM